MRKANEQLKLYKELYDPDKDFSDERPNKLLSVASEKDKEKIKQIFNMYENMDPDDIKNQIATLKSNKFILNLDEIELLDERKTSHQGIKLAKVMYGYEPSEEALKTLRENYKVQKEKQN